MYLEILHLGMMLVESFVCCSEFREIEHYKRVWRKYFFTIKRVNKNLRQLAVSTFLHDSLRGVY